MLATEYLLVDISLINSARSDVSQLNKHNLALETACLASPAPQRRTKQVHHQLSNFDKQLFPVRNPCQL